MRYILFSLVALLLPQLHLKAQVGIGTKFPSPSAALEVSSTNKGVLFPRLTSAQRKGIPNPAAGLMVFDLDKNAYYFFNGSEWMPLGVTSATNLKGVEISAPFKQYDLFGRAAAISGLYAAVSAPNYDTLSFSDIGTVIIYRKSDEGWRFHQCILAPDYESNDQFGTALDMSGDYLVVGAPYKMVEKVSAAGKAYVYKLNKASGFFEIDGQLTYPAGPSNQSYFGFSVGITHRSPVPGGIAVIIGAPLQKIADEQVGTGTASVFQRNETEKYVHLNTINGFQRVEQFGMAVDIDSNLTIVGAPGYDSTTSGGVRFNETGRVQLNRFSNGDYATVDINLSPSPDTANGNGAFVKLDGASFAFGPTNLAQSNPGARLRIYLRISEGFVPTLLSFDDHLSRFEGNANSRAVGYQAAFTPNRIIVGVPHQYFTPYSSGGSSGLRDYVLEFKRTTSSPFPLYRQVFPFDDGSVNTRMGSAVAADGYQVVVTMLSYPNDDGTFGRVMFYTTD